jgi:FAD synthase
MTTENQDLLGYADGVIVRGEGRGRPMGYPTANVSADDESRIPEDGVYFGWFGLAEGEKARGPLTPGGWLPALISVGDNPTFDGHTRTVEAFVIDFDEDLYGAHAIVELTTLVRRQETFDSVDQLVEAMDSDKKAARELMAKYPTHSGSADH